LKGLEDPRNKADNPNPMPLLDIFTRLQGWPNTIRACDFLFSGWALRPWDTGI